MAWKGCDVSEHQESIDWQAVKNDGIEFVIIRVGYGTRCDYAFYDNVAGAKSVGLHIGLYLYTLAENADEAIEEANWAADRADEVGGVDMPIYIDCEESGLEGVADACASTFYDAIVSRGYRSGVYANGNWWANYLDESYWSDKPMWLASYPQDGWSDPSDCPDDNAGIWQCSSSCDIAGIGAIDGDWAFVAEWDGTAPADTEPPAGDKPVSDRPICRDRHFGVWARNVRDNVGVASVKVAIWSTLEGQIADKLWRDMAPAPDGQEGSWAYSVDVNQFGGIRDGNQIITDVYAFDRAGNRTALGRAVTTIDATITPPEHDAIGDCTAIGHVQNIGWQAAAGDGAVCGTTGRSLRLEAFCVQSNIPDVQVQASAHVQDIGWQKFVDQDKGAGTIGQSKRIEAVKLQLSGDRSGQYNIFYRVHVQGIGWMGVAKNGEIAGSIGQSLRVEALQVQIVGKGQDVPKFDPEKRVSSASLSIPDLSGTAHVQDRGWLQTYKAADGGIISLGTTGAGLRLEAVKLLCDSAISGDAHIANIGWCSTQNGSDGIGSTGKKSAIEAIRLRCDSPALAIWYRAHVQNIGWMGWAKNGENAGTAGGGLRMECLQVCVRSKVAPAPGKTDNAFREIARAEEQHSANRPDLNRAIAEMIELVNDESHGYSQVNRWGPDYDCSSAIITALKNAGFDTGSASYTGNMSAELCARGWERRYDDGYPQSGDICLNDANHVAMCVGENGLLAQFSIAETGGVDGESGDQTGGESSVMDFYDYPWDCYLRYAG